MTTVPPDRSHPTALIVEEHALIVPFLADVARAAGFAPVVAVRPTLAKLRRLQPDVVLLGFDLRAVRPLELLRRVRRAMPSAKIVVMTRRDDAVWDAVAHALGADAVLGPRADSCALAAVVRTA